MSYFMGKVYTATGVRDATPEDHLEWLQRVEDEERRKQEFMRLKAEVRAANEKRLAERSLFARIADKLYRWLDS